jgi:dihydrolipoamide dehydrogenase
MYDVAILGAGPGGYTCAIRAAQLGGRVCLIEKDGLGGTCTQRGCIPTKFLHSIGDTVRRAGNAKKYGLNIEMELDYKAIKSKMQATVSRLASGIKILLKSNGVELIDGIGHIVSKSEVIINDRAIKTKNIVIATGSYPICLPELKFEDDLLSTTSILELNELPKSVTIIGAGYSGCEFASILNALGCKVSLIEAENHIMPNQIEEIGNALEKYMTIDGISVRTGSEVEKVIEGKVVANGEEIESDKILVCIGRKPNLNRDELNEIGVAFNTKGISTNNNMETNVDNIYAIGDVTGLYELAHVAAKQGEVAAESIMGMKNASIDYRCVPACVFTYPEVAFVGELSGKVGEFPFTASAKANCLGETRGLVKVYERDEQIVGAYIIGSHAGEIIGEAALAVKLGLSPTQIFGMIHAHPTLPESFAEALRAVENKCIHTPAKNPNTKGNKA